MGTNLFVGGISWDSTDDSLKTAFEEFGTVVSAKIIMDKMTGRSRGFGFVEMSTPEETQAAIAGLNGKPIDGRNVVVNEARPREDRGGEGGNE